jgi:hypothetical protein
LLLAGCINFSPGGEPQPPPDATPDNLEPLPACQAQRAVHLVGGGGGLAWFTLAWPAPAVIDDFKAAYAYDDTSLTIRLRSGAHPLYARRQSIDGIGALWDQRGTSPQPTAFLVGNNETHTDSPISATTSSGANVVAVGAEYQAARLAPLPPAPVLAFDNAPYSETADGPPAVRVTGVDDALNAVAQLSGISSSEAEALRPSPAVIAGWVSSPNELTRELAERLLLAANLMKRGLIGTAIIPALPNDPHGAFTDLDALAIQADDLTNVLEGFYRELDSATEPSCGTGSDPLALADNVVMIVNGDTPKSSFNNSGWPDGTINSVNYLYVRSNGYLIPGWFGEISEGAQTNFDPATGLIDADASDASNLAAAVNAVLYAITRGDASFVAGFDPTTFEGVRAQ